MITCLFFHTWLSWVPYGDQPEGQDFIQKSTVGAFGHVYLEIRMCHSCGLIQQRFVPKESK